MLSLEPPRWHLVPLVLRPMAWGFLWANVWFWLVWLRPERQDHALEYAMIAAGGILFSHLAAEWMPRWPVRAHAYSGVLAFVYGLILNWTLRAKLGLWILLLLPSAMLMAISFQMLIFPFKSLNLR